MAHTVDFRTVSTAGLETSPFASALAGLRASEARYFSTKYDHVFTVEDAADAAPTLEWVHGILRDERDLVIASPPLQASQFTVAGIRFAHVYYTSGLGINVLYTVAPEGKRAVGFKLCEGMPVPEELASRFKFATRRSALAGTVRGSFFIIKGEY